MRLGIEIIEKYFLWLVFYSVVGWIYETILCSIQERHFVNRGFLNGPYCPIYGFGALLDILILGKISNPVYLFLLGAILTCTLEYLTSYFMEKLFNARWWDYSEWKFNIGGRVCLAGGIVFGLFSVLLIKIIHPVICKYTNFLPPLVLHIASATIFIAFIIDAYITIKEFAGFDKKLKEAAAIIKESKNRIADKIHSLETSPPISNIYENVFLMLNKQQQRMLKAFPRLKSKNYNSIIKEIRKLISRRHNKQ